MIPNEEQRAVEGLLEGRAARLDATPLFSPGTADQLRRTLRAEVAGEVLRARRKQNLFFAMGLAAAALLMLLVPPPQGDYGQGMAEVALLEPSGRVLSETAGLRSGEIQDALNLERFVLELVADQTTAVAVRVKIGGAWQQPWLDDPVRLEDGEELLRAIDWPAGEMTLLVVLSERPIPAHRIDRLLARDGDPGLERELGCVVIRRWLTRAIPAR